MTADANATPKKGVEFVKKGRKLALGAVLATSAAGLNAEPVSPELEKILKSPGVSAGQVTDCVDDNSPRTMNLFIGGFFDQTMGVNVIEYHAKLADREKGVRAYLPCNQSNVCTMGWHWFTERVY